MEALSASLAICAGNSPVTGEFPAQRPVTRIFGSLMFSLICVWINGWVNNREAGDLRRYRTHFDVTVMRDPFVFAPSQWDAMLFCNVVAHPFAGREHRMIAEEAIGCVRIGSDGGAYMLKNTNIYIIGALVIRIIAPGNSLYFIS